MKKLLLIVVLCPFIIDEINAQDLKTVRTKDWNNLYQSGFYESQASKSVNNPELKGADWYWGINIAHSINTPDYKYGAQIAFRVHNGESIIPQAFVRSINKEGKGIWAKLLHSKGDHTIDGKLVVKELEIKLVTGADFVFDPSYELRPLAEVKSFILKNKHLPEIPSEKEMQENGLNINDMQIKLLQKIEELTLYTIQLQEQLNEQNKIIQEMQSHNNVK